MYRYNAVPEPINRSNAAPPPEMDVGYVDEMQNRLRHRISTHMYVCIYIYIYIFLPIFLSSLIPSLSSTATRISFG